MSSQKEPANAVPAIEYTVESAPRVRGPRRIVTGDGGEYYWTDDHYDSFSRIERPT